MKKIDFDKEIEKAAKERYSFSEFKIAFIEGANFIKSKMYSEEEVKALFTLFLDKQIEDELNLLSDNDNYPHLTFKKWFELHKKK